MADSPEPIAGDERAARRVLLLAAVALIAVVISGVVLAVSDIADDDEPAARTDTTRRAASGVVDAIGPVRGARVAAYVAERADALADARGTRLAVVSLDDYQAETDAKATVGSGPKVLALLVAAPGGTPEVVTGDLATWADRARRDARALQAGIDELLPTVDDPEYAAFYRDELTRLDRLVTGARADAPVVYGLVVEGSARELQKVATRKGIRVVDVGPGAKAAPHVQYSGLRPEEVVQAGDPDLRP